MTLSVAPILAAGILFRTPARVLLVRRSATGDHAGEWALPGGHIEPGETPEQAAVRECLEEIGTCPTGLRRVMARRVADGVDYTTFEQVVPEIFAPDLNPEADQFVWAEIGAWPEPLHPGVVPALALLTTDELGAAQLIADGQLASPLQFLSVTLYDLRITGTGTAYREARNEYVYRPPEDFLTERFVKRCNGLPVVFDHPEGSELNSAEFNERAVGAIVLPYIKGNEVRGVARIYDASTATLLENEAWSTSPGVVFRKIDGNQHLALADGSVLLVEGSPSLLDHLALCAQGVWDKGGDPTGVESVTAADQEMRVADMMPGAEMSPEVETEEDRARKDAEEKARADKARKDAEAGDKLDRILRMCDTLAKRMDSFETGMKKDPEKTETKVAPTPAATGTDTPPIPEGKTPPPSAREDAIPPEFKAEMDRLRADKARMDAAMKDMEDMKRRVDSMGKEMPEEERAKMADAQARCDSVAQLFNEAAPRPMAGESHLAYRKRLASKYQPHSDRWKGVNLAPMPGDAMATIENDIYADARVAATAPSNIGPGELRRFTRHDETGRKITTWEGDPNTWMSQFRLPPRRLARPLFSGRRDAR